MSDLLLLRISKKLSSSNAARMSSVVLVAGCCRRLLLIPLNAEALLKQAQMLLSLILHMVIQQVFFRKIAEIAPTSQTRTLIAEISQQLKVRAHFMKQVSMLGKVGIGTRFYL